MEESWYEFGIVFRFSSPSRGVIEDEIEVALEETGLGEVVGAGAALDGSFWDISIEVNDLEKGLAMLQKVLSDLKVPKSTVITLHNEDTMIQYPVYE